MLIRIVKMTFEADKVEAFLQIFAASSPLVRAFPGCRHLELWQDRKQPNVLFTHSHWEHEAALEAYRQSELFQTTWARTKALFSDKAAAWSVDRLQN